MSLRYLSHDPQKEAPIVDHDHLTAHALHI